MEEKECEWCGADEDLVLRKPYEFEPGQWVCPDCMEEMPWK
jgi:hypothetical protein